MLHPRASVPLEGSFIGAHKQRRIEIASGANPVDKEYHLEPICHDGKVLWQTSRGWTLPASQTAAQKCVSVTPSMRQESRCVVR